MAARRVSVTRSEVQALAQFVEVFEEYEEEVEDENEKAGLAKGLEERYSPRRQRESFQLPHERGLEPVSEVFNDMALNEDEGEEVLEEEYIEEEYYEEEVIEEEEEPHYKDSFDNQESINKDQAHSETFRKYYDSDQGPEHDTPKKQLPEQPISVRSPDAGEETDGRGGEDDSNAGLPDAEDVIEALQYIIRKEQAVANGFISEEQAKQMVELPLREMCDIMDHFELCDNEKCPIRWDIVALMIHAVDDDLASSDDDEEDATGPGEEGGGDD
jgi:hypothetical protein